MYSQEIYSGKILGEFKLMVKNMTVETNYVSEFTTWLNKEMQEKPHWQQDQQQGRAIWWDKLQAKTADRSKGDIGLVAAKAYPYDVNFFNNKDNG